MAKALDRIEDPARATRKPFAHLGVNNEEFENTGYVRALPITVDIGFCHSDGAAGEGPPRQVPIVQNDMSVRAGRIASHDNRATIRHANIERSSSQVHSG